MRHFVVSSNYPDDPAIQKVGMLGEVLFMRGLAYSAAGDTDGFIPETQLARFGLPKTTATAAKLVMAGLWETVDDGFFIHNWWSWQSEAYAAERKRVKEANRKRAERAAVRGLSVDASVDCPRTVGGLEEKRTLTPLPPHSGGDSCNGQHVNCRGCGTTRRQQERAARNARPDWCGTCDEPTRMLGRDSETPSRCPACHPLAQRSA